ncbi:hypothetical protein [Pseudobutyrivibrio sp.]|uniref:hypothetical protein n=1 Tax=Pseudobutyrivibrio sp. TaxID=2014367 RepID=UPI0038705B5C
MNKYNTLLSSIRKFFDVSDTLRKELDNIAIEEHGKSLDDLLILWARQNSLLNNDAYMELIEYLNELNTEPCISDMQEMYDFIYDFGE